MRKLAAALSAVAVAILLVVVWQGLRRSRHPVTVAELLALLPPELNQPVSPPGDGERRYEALVSLAATIAPADVDGLGWLPKDQTGRTKEASAAQKYALLFAKLDSLIQSGPLRVPDGKDARTQRQALSELDRAAAIAASAAILRRENKEVVRLCLLELNLGIALRRAGGILADQTLARIFEWDALTAIHEAEWNTTLSSEGRNALLENLKPDSGSNPELGEAFGRNLRTITIPHLVDLSAHPERLPRGYGSFDASDTVKLYATVYVQARNDAMSRDDWPWENTARLVSEIKQSLDVRPSSSSSRPPSPLNALMNLSETERSNVYGRKLIAKTNSVAFIQLSRQLAAYRNVVRAILLLRHGKPAVLRDPLGHGNLQIDARRRAVWSVGMNGVDDHGRYGRPGTYAGDLCYRY